MSEQTYHVRTVTVTVRVAAETDAFAYHVIREALRHAKIEEIDVIDQEVVEVTEEELP